MTKLPNILLSRDFFTKGRNRKWIKEHGAEAVIILQAVWIASSQENDCRLDKREVSSLAYPLPFEDEKIIEVCESAIDVGLLEADSTHYFNSQIVKDYQKFQVKQANYSKGREKREHILPESRENSPRILIESTHNHSEYEYEDESDLREGGLGETKPKPGFRDLGYGICISEIEYDPLKLTFSRFGLDEKWITRAAVRLAAWYDKNPTKRSKNGPYLDLASWGVERCLAEKETNERRKNTEKIGKKFEPPPDNRPKSKPVAEVMRGLGIPMKGST